MSSTAHQEVVFAAAEGDNEALTQLVRTYHDRVYRFGQRVCRDGFDADDAVQEAFSKLARRPDVAKTPGVLSWLMAVVRHTCMRLLRPFLRERRSLGTRLDVEEVHTTEPDAQKIMERWELVQAVHIAIASLEPLYREVIILRDLEGMTGDATCAALGIESNAMKSRLHRARGLLREALERDRELRVETTFH